MHDVTRTSAEDCMKLVLAAEGEAGVAAVLIAGESIPEIPAPGTLAHVAGQGADVPDLRCRDRFRRFRQNRVLPADDVVPAQRIECDQTADIHTAIDRPHLIE